MYFPLQRLESVIQVHLKIKQFKWRKRTSKTSASARQGELSDFQDFLKVLFLNQMETVMEENRVPISIPLLQQCTAVRVLFQAQIEPTWTLAVFLKLNKTLWDSSYLWAVPSTWYWSISFMVLWKIQSEFYLTGRDNSYNPRYLLVQRGIRSSRFRQAFHKYIITAIR